MPATMFPIIRVSSADPFERGRQYGEQAAEYIRGSVDVYEETFAYYTGLDWPEIRALAGEFREPIAAYDERIMREIEGIAEGAALPVEDVLAVNVRTEVMYGIGAAGTAECTSFYVGPGASANGHVLVGQNWDWRKRCEKTTVLVEIEQGSSGPKFVMLAEAGLVGKLGFNDHGLAVAANLLISDLDRGDRLVPFHVVLRGILNSRTIEEALAAIVRSKRAASANYLLGSAAGAGLNVETGPGGVETVFLVQPIDDLLAHANTFTCSINFGDLGLETVPDSPGRAMRMDMNLREHHGSLTRDRLAELLRDHDGNPGSVCRHENEAEPPIERASTVASWAIDLTELVASICAGPPCCNEYETFVPSFGTAPVAA
jgi:isopenicillin-N N-acyltransferase like protein